jgi:hypothetical protein
VVPSRWNYKPVPMKIVIKSDTTDEVNLKKAIKEGDIANLGSKINKIIEKTERIINFQKREAEIENSTATIQIQYTRSFVYLTIIQIIIILIVGVYHIFAFRKFLIRNYIINK